MQNHQTINNMRKIIFPLFVLIGCNTTQVPKNDKTFPQKVNDLVLSEVGIGQGFIVKRISKDDVLECSATYLGNIKTNKGEVLKILNNIIYTGSLEDSKHANASINIYTSGNKYVGAYVVGPTWFLPNKIDGSNLVFDYNNRYCNQKTLINLSDSIPKNIFVNCTEKGGDFYSFKK